MPSVSVLMKPASGLCNMQCDYCFYCDEAAKREQVSYGFMSEETLKNVIRKTMSRAEGVVSYAYQGGEPTLRGLEFFEKAVFYQKRYNQNGIRVQNALQTNGYLLDEKWCAFFQREHFLVGLSVDGVRELHDTLRHGKDGGATFDRVVCAARLLDRYRVDYNILTVVTAQVAEQIERIYYSYQKRGWVYQQYIACLDPLEGGHGKESFSLSPGQYGMFLQKLFALWLDDYKRKRQPYIRQFENYVGLAAGYMTEACDQRGSCGIQNVVEADGSVYPCDFYMLDEYRLGNFNVDRLDDINARRKEIGFIEKSLRLSGECKECPYYWLCRGGCQRQRDFQADVGLYRNHLCEGYRMFFDKYYETIMALGRQ